MRTTLAVLALGLILAQSVWAQAGAQGAAAQDPATQGAILFRQECVFCHGVGARGGTRGPDLTTGTWNHGGSDEELTRTIQTGVPGTAMPPNALPDADIKNIVAYLRTLQQAPAAVTGDAGRGETLYFGSGRCASCHMVNGRGGRLGPELSQIGSARSRPYLIESIREPSRQLAPNCGFGTCSLGYVKVAPFDTVTAVTRDGKTIVGVPMNEDTFTIQIMDTGERVYSFAKESLRSLRHENRSLMPVYGPNVLGETDLEDLVAYLQTLRAPSPAPEGGASRAK
jgi:mono/diheme cytochrome c family protein